MQGDIALHSADVAVGEKDPSYGGYGAPEGNPIQGNIMLISGDELADTAKTEARYTVKGLLGKQLLYTARQKDGVLTLDVPAEVATFRTTIEDMQALQASGVKTLVLVTEKNTTTLNLSLLCEGQKSGTRVTLRHLGSSTTRNAAAATCPSADQQVMNRNHKRLKRPTPAMTRPRRQPGVLSYAYTCNTNAITRSCLSGNSNIRCAH